MTDPLATSIATAIATGATTALGDGVRAIVTKLGQLIRKRLRRNSPDQDALEAAIETPRDTAAVERLARIIEQQMRDDPAFAEQVRDLWTSYKDAEHEGAVTNAIHGTVHGSVVQARDVQGGITLHTPPPTP